MRKYIDKILAYFGYVPASTKITYIPRIEYSEHVVRSKEFQKIEIKSDVIFTRMMKESVGKNFDEVKNYELSKRMMEHLKEYMKVSRLPVDDPFSQSEHYRATLIILKD